MYPFSYIIVILTFDNSARQRDGYINFTRAPLLTSFMVQ